MAVVVSTSSIATTTTACLSPQLPLLSLRETVAKINMPAVVQAPMMNPQMTPSSTSVASEPLFNLNLTNGEIHPVTSNAVAAVPKIAVPPGVTLAVAPIKSDAVTTTSQKPIIVTVSNMQMAPGKCVTLTSATNVLGAPLLPTSVHMVAQHFTTEKLSPTSNIVSLPALPRTAGMAPVLSAKPRPAQHITPYIPGGILTKTGQLMIASANSPLISSPGSVITTMSGLSLNNNIVTVTPVIMTSTAPLMTFASNSAVTLNPVSQGQVITTMIQPNAKPTLAPNSKTIVPAAFLKPVNITGPAPFPMTVQPATMAPTAIALAPMQPKEPEVEMKCDPKPNEFDPIQAMEWKDGIATLPGSNLKFKLTEFGTLEMINDDVILQSSSPVKPLKEDAPIPPPLPPPMEDNSAETRQKPSKIKEMYQDESGTEKTPQPGAKDHNLDQELCRCENCDCFGLKGEFCKSGKFCSTSCATNFYNRRSAVQKRGATREKTKKKKLKLESNEEANTPEGKVEVKSEEMKKEPVEVKKEPIEPKKEEFLWDPYLKQDKSVAAPVKLFNESQAYPDNGNAFQIGMKLEGIDPKHPSLFCVLTVSEVKGYRVRLHFDGYSECYDFWVNADSLDIFPVGWCEKTGHILQPPKDYRLQDFNWDNYLKLTKSEAAPKTLFRCKTAQTQNPHFRRGMKLEAVDKKNTSLVCVATITDVMDGRFLIHFDGWEDVYDYWADALSPHLHPINWCRDNGRLLTPPKEIKDVSSFNWTKYLADTRAVAVPPRAFKACPPNDFKVGMKLEAVDRRNPMLIRVATIAHRKEHSLLIHFDGWSSAYDFWVDDDSPDIHPINWCHKTGHPLEPPAVTSPGQPGPCPTAGCMGQGHIKGPKYTTHHSAFGCPYSPTNINKIDSNFQDRVIITKESLNEFTKKISDQGGTTDGLRRCPTPGCNGVGHVKGKYSVHHRVSGCPLAEKNALRGQQSTSSTASSPTPTTTTTVTTTTTSVTSTETKPTETIKTRNGVGRGKKMKIPGLRGRPPKHMSVLRLEAVKKAREATEKSQDMEEKIHDSVFNEPFVTMPKELPLSVEYNTQLIPGLSSIKGSAVRSWSVNQVAKFVSSLKGCLDQGRLFREQLVDGEALLEMTQSDLIDILHLKMGPALKVYSSVVAFKESEKFD